MTSKPLDERDGWVVEHRYSFVDKTHVIRNVVSRDPEGNYHIDTYTHGSESVMIDLDIHGSLPPEEYLDWLVAFAFNECYKAASTGEQDWLREGDVA